jgi:leucyl-tRNA synthetase
VFVQDTITLAVSINGKRRAEIEVEANASTEDILALAKKSTEKWLEDKSIVKEIVVPNKLVNIVIK